MATNLVCKYCDGYGKERRPHCEDGHRDCDFCDGTGGNSLAIDVPGFKAAAVGCDWILYEDNSFEVIGRKTHDKKVEVRYADFVFQGAIGDSRSLLEDLP